jgi:hypothetical protein
LTNYCLDCKQLYDLNDRAFQIFDSSCDICGKSGYVYICPYTEIDEDLGVVIWKKPINIKIGKRKATILINKFDNLLTNEEKIQWLCITSIVKRCSFQI